MIYKTMIAVLLLCCAWGTPASAQYPLPSLGQPDLGGKRPPRPYEIPGGRKILEGEYKQWSKAEQLFHVSSFMEGMWGAIQFTGRYWRYWAIAFVHCKVEPEAVWKAYRDDKLPLYDGEAISLKIQTRYYELCRDAYGDGPGLPLATFATYKDWPQPKRIRYMEAAMNGIAESFDGTGYTWPKARQAPFLQCTVERAAVEAALAKLDDGKLGKRTMGKLIFTAYETACREAKAK